MIAFVYGGSGSGKSEYAESLVTSFSKDRKRYYVATMMAYGEEGARRVERHRKLRAGKGFETIECPTDILRSLESIPDREDAVILLECIPNLVANEMFKGYDEAGNESNIINRTSDTPIYDKLFGDIRELCSKVGDIVIVSDNVFEDGMDYSEETLTYMEYLGKVNEKIAGISDSVTEVVAGIPLVLKEKEK